METQAVAVRQEHPIEALEKMGQYIAKSGLFGMKSPEQAVALMILAQAKGLHPGTIAEDYHIIQNRPALKADTMLARFQAAGGSVQWDEYTDTRVVGTFSHPQGGKLTVDWDMDRAKKAGLGSKDNWKSYPRAMLRARVISEGIRTVYPGVLGGMYTPEEVSDFDEKPPQTNEKTPPARPKPPKAPEATPEPTVAEKFAAMVQKKKADMNSVMLYVTAKAHDVKVTPEAVQEAALGRMPDFWKGYEAWKANPVDHAGTAVLQPETVPCPDKDGAEVPVGQCATCEGREGCPSHDGQAGGAA